MAKFRKKPSVLEVEAEQFDPNAPHNQWPFGVEWEPEFRDQDGSKLGGFHKLRLLGGFEFINAGDWVVFSNGGPRVMSDAVFKSTYEPVTTPPTTDTVLDATTLASKLIEAVEWTGVGNPYEHEPKLSMVFCEGATEYSKEVKKRLRDTCKKLGVNVDG